jgi:hypothetical protein
MDDDLKTELLSITRNRWVALNMRHGHSLSRLFTAAPGAQSVRIGPVTIDRTARERTTGHRAGTRYLYCFRDGARPVPEVLRDAYGRRVIGEDGFAVTVAPVGAEPPWRQRPLIAEPAAPKPQPIPAAVVAKVERVHAVISAAAQFDTIASLAAVEVGELLEMINQHNNEAPND